MNVCKFGGTSMASAAQFEKVYEIIKADQNRKIVVVSAPGKRSKEDTKVTDLLIACATKYLVDQEAEQELQRIIGRYQEIADDLRLPFEIMERITNDLRAILNMDVSNPEAFLDAMKAAGEDNSAKLLACYLQSKGLDAEYVNPRDAGLLVSDEFGNAQVLEESYARLAELKQRSGIVVFPGFFGYSSKGALVTFSRGGSDITGSILAAAVKADLYENFTDVDSVFVVNPTLIANPRKINEITYREMRELSYAGFSVFHEEALLPAFRAGIPVCIKNTNNPSAPGTMIVSERHPQNNPIAGIASDAGFCSIYVSKYLMNREIGFGRRLLQIIEDEGLSYEHTPSGIDNISVILRENQLDAEKEARVLSRMKEELQVDDVSIQHDLALVMIVGEGMRRSIGISSRATTALAQASVNLEMINQGSSEVSMMFGVKAEDADSAVIALYHEFFLI
ncbi:aspartate kinase [Brevibacillus sp. SYSU BS000544]|uniref:aspartate kinase n=1 Tax=Brevibacillus sp. SYSU BS000544 TaxID=3416443 RepID=UPI003CE49F22